MNEDKRLLECRDGLNLEVACNEQGQMITSHAKLQRLINDLSVSYVFNIILADPKEMCYICQCDMTDTSTGRTVSAIGEVDRTTIYTEAEKSRPARLAAARAFDQAALQMLCVKEKIYLYSDVSAQKFFERKRRTQKGTDIKPSQLLENGSIPAPAKNEAEKPGEKFPETTPEKIEKKEKEEKTRDRIIEEIKEERKEKEQEEKQEKKAPESESGENKPEAPENKTENPEKEKEKKALRFAFPDNDITTMDDGPIAKARPAMPRELTDTVLIGALKGEKYEKVKDSKEMTEFIVFLKENPEIIDKYPDRIQKAQAKFFRNIEL